MGLFTSCKTLNISNSFFHAIVSFGVKDIELLESPNIEVLLSPACSMARYCTCACIRLSTSNKLEVFFCLFEQEKDIMVSKNSTPNVFLIYSLLNGGSHHADVFTCQAKQSLSFVKGS